jgi:hypothetical protein
MDYCSEINNKGFEIQHSIDNAVFEQAGFVDGPEIVIAHYLIASEILIHLKQKQPKRLIIV